MTALLVFGAPFLIGSDQSESSGGPAEDGRTVSLLFPAEAGISYEVTGATGPVDEFRKDMPVLTKFYMSDMFTYVFSDGTQVRVTAGPGYSLGNVGVYTAGSETPEYCWPSSGFDHVLRGDTEFRPEVSVIVYSISYPTYEEPPGFPTSYTVEDRVEIPDLENRATDHREFLGWSDGLYAKYTLGFVIEAGSTGDKNLYDHWESHLQVTADLNGMVPDPPYDCNGWVNFEVHPNTVIMPE